MQSTTGLNVTVWGDGEPAVLVHGSFGWGSKTWEKQRPLAETYRLLLPDRRGFGGSPPEGRVDFDRDADDVADLLAGGAHLVGHSYGGVVSLLAAGRRPDAVRSLTVIEPPALGLVREDPLVEKFIAGAKTAMREAEDPSDYRVRFLRAFGFPARDAELQGLGLEAARSSWRERPPWEAEIPLDELRGVHILVVREIGRRRLRPPVSSAAPRCTRSATCSRLGSEPNPRRFRPRTIPSCSAIRSTNGCALSGSRRDRRSPSARTLRGNSVSPE